MRYVADLHLHSKYSRAVSQDMVLPVMAEYAKKKGLDILTTGDFTHPLWFRGIKTQLEEYSEGIYKLKDEKETLFMLTTEISSIYSQGGRTRRIHNLVFSPSVETCENINQELFKRGCNLTSDGRPIIGLSSKYLLELLLSIDEKIILIPCHAWTPWFALYGSFSGFDSIEECFGEYSKYIYAVETGLSSDPEMNWRIKELDGRSIVSFSDSHSPMKMGREATVFELKEASYENIRKAIMKLSVFGSQLSENSQSVISQSVTDEQKTDNRIAFTIEFYPEEGKYHYTGHRKCKIIQSPQDSKLEGIICTVCKRPLTVGVMHRVQQLAEREISHPKDDRPLAENDEYGVRWIEDPTKKHPPFVRLVPLIEIIAESFFSTVASVKVKSKFDELCEKFGSEMDVLLNIDLAEIQKYAGPRIAEGLKKVRSGDIVIEPGFDGEYGKVRIWPLDLNYANKENKMKTNNSLSQLSLDF